MAFSLLCSMNIVLPVSFALLGTTLYPSYNEHKWINGFIYLKLTDHEIAALWRWNMFPVKKKPHSKSPCKTNVNKFEHMYTGLIVNTSDLN